jgi:lipopolysaccharide export LptBFGC system permease protein LptF
MKTILLSGITSEAIASLFAIIFVLPSIVLTLIFFVLSRVFQQEETARKVFIILTVIGVIISFVAIGFCTFVYFT